MKKMLLFLYCVYILLRIFGIFHFAPHNDEVISIEIAGKMSKNWELNKFFFMDGRVPGEYKESLHFWADSLTINLFNNPLFGPRMLSLLLGFCGMFFTQLLVEKVWNKTAALFTVLLIIFSEFYFYVDSIAITEPFVYGLGAVYLYFCYEFISLNSKKSWISGVIMTLFLFGILLSKRSGAHWILFASILPLFLIFNDNNKLREGLNKTDIINFVYVYIKILSGVVIAKFVHYLIIPSQFSNLREKNAHTDFLRSFDQLIQFPVSGWLSNIKFYWDILYIEFSYMLVPLIFMVFMVIYKLKSDKNKHLLGKYLVFILLTLSAFIPIILIAKVQFVRHFSTALYFVHMTLGVGLSVFWDKGDSILKKYTLIFVMLCVLVWKIISSWSPLIIYGNTDLSMKETPATWANGSGIIKLVDYLSNLSEGVLIVDPAWGHPGTAVKIFRKKYPQLKLLPLKLLVDQYKNIKNEQIYFVFDSEVKRDKPLIGKIILDKRLCSNKHKISKQYKGKLLKGSMLLVCSTNFKTD